MLGTSKLAAQKQMAAKSLAQCRSAEINHDEFTKMLRACNEADDKCDETRYV